MRCTLGSLLQFSDVFSSFIFLIFLFVLLAETKVNMLTLSATAELDEESPGPG